MAVFFAVAMVVLTPLVLGALDIYMVSLQRSRLQDALDAAALYAARSTATDPHEITTIGQRALNANIKLIPGSRLHQSSFELVGNKIVAQAILEPTSIASNLWEHGNMTVGTEVVRSSMNLEVALVVDVTESMGQDASGGGGKKIDNLKLAANELIDIIVQANQSPYYSKIAIVPYSNGVNVGALAATVRGSVPGGKAVTSAVWKAAGATGKGISGISKANPGVVTANGHGFSNGNYVHIDGVKGMTQVNGRSFTISDVTTNTFKIGINTSSYSNYQSSTNDLAIKCAKAGCATTVTANAHGFADGDKIVISDTEGTYPNTAFKKNIEGRWFTVANRTANTFDLTGQESAGFDTINTTKTTAYCTSYGCEWYLFDNAASTQSVFRTSTCATERIGTEAYTDAAPSTALVGRQYPAPTSPCPGDAIMPLSSDKDALKLKIADLDITGYTAGQIGLGWGWYMISPNFADLWTDASSRPAAYTRTDVLKVVILMTDGQFNTAYYNGVIAKDSSYTGDPSRINTNASNGKAYTQAQDLCAAMDEKKIIIYTVGFDIGSDVNANAVMTNCATSPNHKYLPSSGTALKTAFKAIAQDINSLRLAH